MKRILVCQHVAYEPLGTLDPLFKKHGFRIRYVNFGRHPHAEPTLEGYHALVILGGPMNVDQIDLHPHLAYEVKLIRDALSRQIPILGICLGAQLIAKSLGAPVTKNRVKEIGWSPVSLTEAGKKDAILAHLKETETLFQWHGDTFALPENAVHLALSNDCPMQAFRYGDRVYGFQFHLEVDERLIHRWLKVSGNQDELAELGDPTLPEKILKQTPQFIERLKELSIKTFGEFIKLLGTPKRYHTLTYR